VFCDRKGEAVIKGHNLRIEREPTAEEVIADIGDPRAYREIVFCGYGEPTIRLEVMKEVARWVKGQGGRTRLNTDGHGSIINHRNIVPELVGLIDSISVSLNSPDPAQYGELMRLDPGVYFPAMIEFARESWWKRKSERCLCGGRCSEPGGGDGIRSRDAMRRGIVVFRGSYRFAA
jgi:TatD DNase family protein